MRNWLAKMQPSPWLLNKLVILALLAAVGAGGFYVGRRQGNAKVKTAGPEIINGDPPSLSSHGGRVVAYIYDDIPVTREEFGEYLIARFGKERLEFMVNRKIVDIECRKANVFATEAEIEQRLQQDLRSFAGNGTTLTVEEFEKNFLRRFNKSLYEWKEDVIRPKIMMEKLVRDGVKITEKDLHDGFEARFGPQVQCRMIVLDGKNLSVAQKVWEQARLGRKEFLEQARKQFIPQLASAEGKVPPISKHLGDKDLEDAAFRMKEGEISGLLEMRDGSRVILMCEKHLPENKIVRFEAMRTQIFNDMREGRVAQTIPNVLVQFRQNARPRYVLDNRGEPSSGIVPASYSKTDTYQFNPRPVEPPPGIQKGTLPPNRPLQAPQNLKKPAEPKQPSSK